jgi:3-oxoacyl-[acyl-carrier-protein] synthase-3
MTQAYITGTGAYLPGEPVDNQQLAARFGDGTRRDAALRRRVLAANGIRTRHYAVDDSGMTTMPNEELAASAAQRALADRGLPAPAAGMLATGTTQGDVLVPGFASMVHGRLGGGPMETAVGRRRMCLRNGRVAGRGVRGPARGASGGGRRRLRAGQPLAGPRPGAGPRTLPIPASCAGPCRTAPGPSWWNPSRGPMA